MSKKLPELHPVVITGERKNTLFRIELNPVFRATHRKMAGHPELGQFEYRVTSCSPGTGHVTFLS